MTARDPLLLRLRRCSPLGGRARRSSSRKNPIRGAMGLLAAHPERRGALPRARTRSSSRRSSSSSTRARSSSSSSSSSCCSARSSIGAATAAAWSRASSAAGLFALAGLGALAAVARAAPAGAARCPCRRRRPRFGGIDAFGSVLFADALVPFELSSALLMVAVVGAVAVARGRQGVHVAVEGGARGRRQRPARRSEAPRLGRLQPRDPPGRRRASRERRRRVVIPIEHYVALSALLFVIGGVGFLVRRNVLVAADEHRGDAQRGQPGARRVQPLAHRARATRSTRARATRARCSPSSSSPPRPPRSPWASPSSSPSTACAAPSGPTRRTS